MVAVALVHYPSEGELRLSLAEGEKPRLLLVENGTPPLVTDPFEDWIMMPADAIELSARLENLKRRWENPGKPGLDENGVLTWRGLWVALSPIEARLAGVLLERFGALVSHRALADAWGESHDVQQNSLNVQIHRLRRRLGPVGLVVRTVRKRGYVLEAVNTEPPGRS